MLRRTIVLARKAVGPFVLESPPSKKALVVGSSGALGKAVVHQLMQQGLTVLQADIVNDGSSSNFCDLSSSTNLTELTTNLAKGVNKFLEKEGTTKTTGTPDQLKKDEKLDVVVCAAGGWTGNPPLLKFNRKPLEEQAHNYAYTMDLMRQLNLDPVFATGFLLPHFMNQESLCVMIGATAALQATPDMVGYGIFKSAVHSYVQTMGSATTRSLEVKSVRDRAKILLPVSIVGILPNVLDTPNNRQHLKTTKIMTPPSAIAEKIGEWVQTPAVRPHSGALIKVTTNNKGEHAFWLVD